MVAHGLCQCSGPADLPSRLGQKPGMARRKPVHCPCEVAPPIEHPLSASPYRSCHRSTGRAGGTRRRLASRESEVAACASFNPEPTVDGGPAGAPAEPVARVAGAARPGKRGRLSFAPTTDPDGQIGQFVGKFLTLSDSGIRWGQCVRLGYDHSIKTSNRWRQRFPGRSATCNVGVRAASGWPFWPLFPRR